MVRALFLALLVFPAVASAQQKPPSREPGRFQVVNGTPQMTRNIMLLDTVTGETWVLCTDVNENAAWCKMPKYETPAGPRDESAATHAGS